MLAICMGDFHINLVRGAVSGISKYCHILGCILGVFSFPNVAAKDIIALWDISRGVFLLPSFRHAPVSYVKAAELNHDPYTFKRVADIDTRFVHFQVILKS
eukprot:gene7448-13211_t